MSKRYINTHGMLIFDLRELSLPLPSSGSTSAQEGHMSSVTAVPVTPAVGAAWTSAAERIGRRSRHE
jgi:hypothetical protein